ncbi:MAG: hypothetical protein V8R80_11075 [Eubacterium sp.]
MLNAEINTLIDMIEANGDSIVNDLNLHMTKKGNLSYLVEGEKLLKLHARISTGHEKNL